jgi:hypothetical protein
MNVKILKNNNVIIHLIILFVYLLALILANFFIDEEFLRKNLAHIGDKKIGSKWIYYKFN